MKRSSTASSKQLSLRYNPDHVHPRVAKLLVAMAAHDAFRDARKLTASGVLRIALMVGLSSLEAKYVGEAP